VSSTIGRVQAREQFFDMEWLDEIVVSALLEARHLVLPAGARSQDQDRKALAGGAQILDQFHAGFFRQAQIDDRHVERHFAAEIQAFLAIGRSIHREAFAFQPRRERLAQRRLIFHQQYAHDPFPCVVRPACYAQIGLWNCCRQPRFSAT